MKKKKHIIYLDILGFNNLALEIAEKTGINEDIIREKFLSEPLKKTIRKIQNDYQIHEGISEIEGSDNYILLIKEVQTIFELIDKLISIEIPHKDYDSIPLEICVGTKNIDENINVDLINRKEIIEFLKNDLINPYRKYYNDRFGKRIIDTFVIFSTEFFNYLEPLDKKYCEKIPLEKEIVIKPDINKIKQRARVFDFLSKIGHQGSKWYGRIDEVYIFPSEYGDMKTSLNDNKIIFITGTQEYGKTYTAVRLLWDYYNCGYNPKWIKGAELLERNDVRQKLENSGSYLKSGHIVYFEDPFGKIEYEKRENLERDIGIVIDSIRQVDNAYAILTSREEVFKEFNKEKLSLKELEEFEIKINVKKPSYDYEKRKEMVLLWAEEEECKWLANEKLKNFVLEYLSDDRILPTPLSIKSFAIATINTEEKYELYEKIIEKSKETSISFANEIKRMDDDKILFLSFLFISDALEIEFYRDAYNEMANELNLKDFWEFDKILNWFRTDKINISFNKFIEFSHSSYYGALEFLLIEEGTISRINKDIFSKVLLRLSEKDESDVDFDNIVDIISNYSDKLPKNVRNELLLKISNDEKINYSVAYTVAKIIVDNYTNLPENIKEILFLLYDNVNTPDVMRAISYGFNKLPENVTNLLFYPTEENKIWVSYIIENCFVLNGIFRYPDNLRNELLIKLSENDDFGRDIAMGIANNYNKLPDKIRNLLFQLSEKEQCSWAVAGAVAKNFNNLPENVRDLIIKLSEKEECAWPVAGAVAGNFNKLPEKERNILYILSENKKTAEAVAWNLDFHFHEIPEKRRNQLLLNLSEKNEALEIIADIVAYNFDSLPENLRNNLLIKLSKMIPVNLNFQKSIENNCKKIPEEINNLFDTS